jgi:ubiquinone/menaquinone biosynthesis C-methylase UbiE
MQVKAMDISEYAAMKCPFKNIDFILSPSWDMAIQSKSIEFIHSMFCFNAIPEHLMKKTFEEMDRVCIPNSLIFIILNLGKENKQDGNYNFLYTEEFFNNIANELGMTSEKAKYHIRLMTMHSPGWDFMRQYKWSYLLYRTKK